MLSMYYPGQEINVYCQPCWWADSWDGTEYGVDYDPSRPFLEQVKELSKKVPYTTLETNYLTLKNCDFSNAIAYSKECYLVTWADYCDNVFYSSILNGLRQSSDCIRGWDSELCYDSIGFIRNYRVFGSDECNDCVDVWFSRNCYSCTNCIGCVNLRGATNCIFNVKYSHEEYEKKMNELKLDSWKNLKNLEKKSRKFWLTQPQREYHGNSMNLNVTGEYSYESKNSKEGYIMNYAENSKWVQFLTVPTTKDCYDYSGWGHNSELVYESLNIGDGASNVKFSGFCFSDVENIEYSWWCVSGKNNFGCIGLKRKQYCILNKEYSKEEYEKLKVLIIEDMKKNPYVDKMGRIYGYGEYFSEFGKFAYNNSSANRFFPKTKEAVAKEGYEWNDFENPTLEATIKSKSLPDTIKETTDSILEEVIECSKCSHSYRIVKGELGLLRKMGLPLPHECSRCRESARFARMNRPGMYHRACDKCKEPIYTPYAPDRPEIVYCVKDYQALFS
jgi:hypothetical protein